MNAERQAKIPAAIKRLTRVCKVGLSAGELPCDALYDDIKLLLQLAAECNPDRTPQKAPVLETRLEDYQRLQAWAEEQPRRPASSAFTAGPLRDAAYAVESRLTKLESIAYRAARLIGYHGVEIATDDSTELEKALEAAGWHLPEEVP